MGMGARKYLTYNGAGAYVVRCRRPGFIGRLNIPIISRHTGYVGESMHVRAREMQHRNGSKKYGAMPQPWSDLDPKWYAVPLPPVRAITLAVEAFLIFLLWPVYNHKKNLWNPRRIPLSSAKRQRAQRDLIGWSFNLRPIHIAVWVALAILFGPDVYGMVN
jgi:hypothetical protein